MSRRVRFTLTAVLIVAAVVVLALSLLDTTVPLPQFATRP